MCTSLKLKYKNHYVCGRNLDLEYHFGESVIALNETYLMRFKFLDEMKTDKRIIGIGSLVRNYPLFAEAINSDGLFIAGLNYPNNAFYNDEIKKEAINLAPYEIVNYILLNFKSVDEVK